MSNKWDALQTQFLIEHKKTGISAKAWCQAQGLNYASARRYIKVSKAAHPLKRKACSTPDVKKALEANKRKRAQIGNQHGLVHGGYSKYFRDHELGVMIEATTLEDELMLCRSRIHVVIKAMESIQAELNKQPSVEVAASLYESLFKADKALDANIARVESITKTLSSIQIDQVNFNKILADTDKSKEQAQLYNLKVAEIRKAQGSGSKLDNYIDELVVRPDKVVK